MEAIGRSSRFNQLVRSRVYGSVVDEEVDMIGDLLRLLECFLWAVNNTPILAP
jgi:hypothetical protein